MLRMLKRKVWCHETQDISVSGSRFFRNKVIRSATSTSYFSYTSKAGMNNNGGCVILSTFVEFEAL